MSPEPESAPPGHNRQLSLIKKDLGFSDAEALEKTLRQAAVNGFQSAFGMGFQMVLQTLVARMNVTSASTPKTALELGVMYFEDYVREAYQKMERGEPLVDVKVFQQGPNNPPRRGGPPGPPFRG